MDNPALDSWLENIICINYDMLTYSSDSLLNNQVIHTAQFQRSSSSGQLQAKESSINIFRPQPEVVKTQLSFPAEAVLLKQLTHVNLLFSKSADCSEVNFEELPIVTRSRRFLSRDGNMPMAISTTSQSCLNSDPSAVDWSTKSGALAVTTGCERTLSAVIPPGLQMEEGNALSEDVQQLVLNEKMVVQSFKQGETTSFKRRRAEGNDCFSALERACLPSVREEHRSMEEEEVFDLFTKSSSAILASEFLVDKQSPPKSKHVEEDDGKEIVKKSNMSLIRSKDDSHLDVARDVINGNNNDYYDIVDDFQMETVSGTKKNEIASVVGDKILLNSRRTELFKEGNAKRKAAESIQNWLAADKRTPSKEQVSNEKRTLSKEPVSNEMCDHSSCSVEVDKRPHRDLMQEVRSSRGRRKGTRITMTTASASSSFDAAAASLELDSLPRVRFKVKTDAKNKLKIIPTAAVEIEYLNILRKKCRADRSNRKNQGRISQSRKTAEMIDKKIIAKDGPEVEVGPDDRNNDTQHVPQKVRKRKYSESYIDPERKNGKDQDAPEDHHSHALPMSKKSTISRKIVNVELDKDGSAKIQGKAADIGMRVRKDDDCVNLKHKYNVTSLVGHKTDVATIHKRSKAVPRKLQDTISLRTTTSTEAVNEMHNLKRNKNWMNNAKTSQSEVMDKTVSGTEICSAGENQEFQNNKEVRADHVCSVNCHEQPDQQNQERAVILDPCQPRIVRNLLTIEPTKTLCSMPALQYISTPKVVRRTRKCVATPNQRTLSQRNRKKAFVSKQSYLNSDSVPAENTKVNLAGPEVAGVGQDVRAAGARRSQRTRVKTLDWFRNERIQYERQESGFVVAGIIIAEKESKVGIVEKSAKKILHKEKLNKKKRKAVQRNLSIHTELTETLKPNIQFEIKVINPETREEVHMDCIKTYERMRMVGVSGQPPSDDEPLLLCKPIRQRSFASGTLIIRPLQVKKTQYVQNDTMLFHIIHGKVQVTIHETKFIAETRDKFFVPVGNSYSIRNLCNENAELDFTQIKS